MSNSSHIQRVFGLLVGLSIGAAADAQGFNVDIGLSTPPNTHYAAATQQFGRWNLVSATATAAPLLDLHGAATAATITCSPPGVDSAFSVMSGSNGALLNDRQLLTGGVLYTWSVAGLANGRYRVTIYAKGEEDFDGWSEYEVLGGIAGPQICHGSIVTPFLYYRYLVSMVQDTVTVTNGTLTWTARDAGGMFGSFCGFQIEPLVEGSVTAYCTANPNSLGCVPTIFATGSASVSANTFRVHAANVLNNRPGFLFWGRGQNYTHVLGLPARVLCVGGVHVRTDLQDSSGNPAPDDCSGSYSFHWNTNYLAQQGLSAGDLVCCQYWSQDEAASGGCSFTGALSFVLAP
jgi:hypothetical protein